MTFRLCGVGVVVGEHGLDCLHRHLRQLKKEHEPHFVVINGENAAGVGLLPRHAEELFDAGADAITLGNHTWDKQQICDYLATESRILRPFNYDASLPGVGASVFSVAGLQVALCNLMGRLNLNPHLRSPFDCADDFLNTYPADHHIVAFHAEASS